MCIRANKFTSAGFILLSIGTIMVVIQVYLLFWESFPVAGATAIWLGLFLLVITTFGNETYVTYCRTSKVIELYGKENCYLRTVYPNTYCSKVGFDLAVGK